MAGDRVLSVRREMLDSVVVFSKEHLRKLLNSYVAYYHQDRPHLSLEKDTPCIGRSRRSREVAGRSSRSPVSVGCTIGTSGGKPPEMIPSVRRS